ncbi:HEPN domain-containing protein [Planctomycetota bacterium]
MLKLDAVFIISLVMVDISEQIKYWKAGAQEDWEAAGVLVESGKIRQGLFFAHLALEKLLKAHVCRQRQEIAPRIHNLVRLAELADLKLDDNRLDTLAEMNEFNIEGRYPLNYVQPPNAEEASTYMTKADEVYLWLIQRL